MSLNAVQTFHHEGFDIAFIDSGPTSGSAGPILLIHGFASTHTVNWVNPGWVKSLTHAGYRVIALDNRGHGQSSKSYDPADYTPAKMAQDSASLLRHLSIPRAHVFGYSMGARLAVFLALAEPGMVASLVLGGLGIGLVEGVGDWDPIAQALLAEDPATISHQRGRMFRAFADQTKSDRKALAACIRTSRELVTEEQIARVSQPTLIGVGTTDDIAGSAEELAALMPNATAFAIEGRDHMLSVGDRTFRQRVLTFLQEHPL
jgi:pimeloyl-ACP methyl ester carboxylesterase